MPTDLLWKYISYYIAMPKAKETPLFGWAVAHFRFGLVKDFKFTIGCLVRNLPHTVPV